MDEWTVHITEETARALGWFDDHDEPDTRTVHAEDVAVGPAGELIFQITGLVIAPGKWIAYEPIRSLVD